MSLQSLSFKIGDEEIYTPPSLSTGETTVLQLYNEGLEDITDIGIYIVTSEDLGTYDNVSEDSPAVDYQTLLTWGQDTVLAEDTQGGLKITYFNGIGDVTAYFSRSQGADYSSKIALQDIPAGDYIEVTLELESPTGEPARKLYISLAVE